MCGGDVFEVEAVVEVNVDEVFSRGVVPMDRGNTESAEHFFFCMLSSEGPYVKQWKTVLSNTGYTPQP